MCCMCKFILRRKISKSDILIAHALSQSALASVEAVFGTDLGNGQRIWCDSGATCHVAQHVLRPKDCVDMVLLKGG